MKVILSRKGFDTANGGIPNPILPDGTLLSMPIPSDDALTFGDLAYKGCSYSNILRQLAPNHKYGTLKQEPEICKCHLDPDIRVGVRVKSVKEWQPAFGQIGAAQSCLYNNNIKPGDLFLFFGRFQKTDGSISEGTLHFDNGSPVLHIIYGYMEIGEILRDGSLEARNYYWHPHGKGERLLDKTNAIYLPAERLSIDTKRNGWGVFEYSDGLVDKLTLTLSNKTATWREIPALMPDNITANRKNSAPGQGIYYKGIWQEMVLKETAVSEHWAKSIFG